MRSEEFKKHLASMDDETLVSHRVMIEAEMAARNISIDVGYLGEKLAIEFSNSTPGLPNLMKAPKGAKNVDALSRDGERYSIKAIMKAKKTGTVYPDRQNPDKQLFEHLLIVCLNGKYQLDSIYSFSWEMFLSTRAWDKRMNAWYIPVSGKRLQMAAKLFPRERWE